MTLSVLFIIIAILAAIWFIYYFLFRQSEPFENEPKWLDGVDVIYWINLDRSKDRRRWMEKLLDNPVFQDIPNERISAIDGKKTGLIESMLNGNKSNLASDSEYGCFLSHLETIKKLSESNYKTAIIFEDDMTLDLKPYWKNNMKNVISNAPEDWDIIQLCYNSVDNTKQFLKEEYTKNKANGELKGAYAYLINKKAATKLMNNILQNEKYNLDPNIHHSSDVYLYSVLNSYVYKYPMFIYKTDNDSTIHSEHLTGHELNKMAILDIYNKNDKVVFIIPSTSRNMNYKHAESCSLLKTLYASLRKLETTSKYTFLIGTDDDDEFYNDNIDNIKTRLPDNFKFHILNNYDKSYVCIVNQLADIAINKYGADYIYVFADDLDVYDLSFIEKDFLLYFKKNGGLSLGWGIDENWPDICTHPFVSKMHVNNLGYFYPSSIKNVGCDDWIQKVYETLGKMVKSKTAVIKNTIGSKDVKRYDVSNVNVNSKEFVSMVNSAVQTLRSKN